MQTVKVTSIPKSSVHEKKNLPPFTAHNFIEVDSKFNVKILRMEESKERTPKMSFEFVNKPHYVRNVIEINKTEFVSYVFDLSSQFFVTKE